MMMIKHQILVTLSHGLTTISGNFNQNMLNIQSFKIISILIIAKATLLINKLKLLKFL